MSIIGEHQVLEQLLYSLAFVRDSNASLLSRMTLSAPIVHWTILGESQLRYLGQRGNINLQEDGWISLLCEEGVFVRSYCVHENMYVHRWSRRIKKQRLRKQMKRMFWNLKWQEHGRGLLQLVLWKKWLTGQEGDDVMIRDESDVGSFDIETSTLSHGCYGGPRSIW